MSSSFNLSPLMRVVEAVRQLDPEMPAQTLMAFLIVADADPEAVMQQELGEKLGVSRAALTRNVLFLSAERAVGVPGHGLIEAEIVPENRKLRRLRLTSKGKRFAEKVAKMIDA